MDSGAQTSRSKGVLLSRALSEINVLAGAREGLGLAHVLVCTFLRGGTTRKLGP